MCASPLLTTRLIELCYLELTKVVVVQAIAGVLWFAIPVVFSLSTGIAAVAYDLPFSGPELNNVLLLPGTSFVPQLVT